MGIKSTRELTRREALELYESLLARLHGRPSMTDVELGDALDRLDEAVCELDGQTCFTNYLVVPEKW